MPRFFIDIDDGKQGYKDEEGAEFVGREAARIELIAALANITKDALPDGNIRDFRGIVRDEAGKEVFTATLSLRSGWVN